jgi:hypothetical protein
MDDGLTLPWYLDWAGSLCGMFSDHACATTTNPQAAATTINDSFERQNQREDPPSLIEKSYQIL